MNDQELNKLCEKLQAKTSQLALSCGGKTGKQLYELALDEGDKKWTAEDEAKHKRAKDGTFTKGSGGGIKQAIADAANKVKTAVGDVASKAKTAGENATTTAKESADKVKTAVGDAASKAKTAVDSAANTVKEKGGEAKNSLDETVAKTKAAVDDAKAKAEGAVNQVKKTAKEVGDSAARTADLAKYNIEKTGKDLAEKAQMIKDNPEEVKKATGEKVNQIRAKTGESLNKFKASAEEKLSGVKEEVNQKVKESWDEPGFQTARTNVATKAKELGDKAATGFTKTMEAGKAVASEVKNPKMIPKLATALIDEIGLAVDVAREEPDIYAAGAISAAYLTMGKTMSTFSGNADTKAQGEELMTEYSEVLENAAAEYGAVRENHKALINEGKEQAASAIVSKSISDLSEKIKSQAKGKVDEVRQTKVVKAVEEAAKNVDVQKAVDDLKATAMKANPFGHGEKNAAVKHYEEMYAAADTSVEGQNKKAQKNPLKEFQTSLGSLSDSIKNGGSAATASIAGAWSGLNQLAHKVSQDPDAAEKMMHSAADSIGIASKELGTKMKDVSSKISASVKAQIEKGKAKVGIETDAQKAEREADEKQAKIDKTNGEAFAKQFAKNKSSQAAAYKALTGKDLPK